MRPSANSSSVMEARLGEDVPRQPQGPPQTRPSMARAGSDCAIEERAAGHEALAPKSTASGKMADGGLAAVLCIAKNRWERQDSSQGGSGRAMSCKGLGPAIDVHWPILPLSNDPHRQRPVASRRHDLAHARAPLFLFFHLVLPIDFAASAASQSPTMAFHAAGAVQVRFATLPTSRH